MKQSDFGIFGGRDREQEKCFELCFELGTLTGLDREQGKLYIQLLARPGDAFSEYCCSGNKTRPAQVFVQSLTLCTRYRDIFRRPLTNPKIDIETYTFSTAFSSAKELPDDLPKGMTVFVGNARLEEFHEPDWYHNIKKEYYSDLDSCVQYAVSTGNHRAFACYYTECCHSRKDIFYQYFVRFKTSKGNLDGVKILHPKWWRALNLDYDTKLTYKNAVIKKQTINIWFGEQKDSGTFNIPKRIELLQCAICLGFSGEETNRLLLAAGYEELYPADVEDAVFWFYLDDYAAKAGKNISSYDKLKTVHERIRKKLLELCNSGKLQSALVKQKTEDIDLKIVLSGTPVGKGITDLIEQYKKYREEKSNSAQSRFAEPQSGLTEYVTKTIRSFWPLASPDGEEASDGKDPDPLDRFFADVQMQCTQSDNSVPSNIFTQRHYGYLRKSVQFFDGYKRYLKNLRERSCDWDSLWEMWNEPGRKEQWLRPELAPRKDGKEPAQTWKQKALKFIWSRSYDLIPEVSEGSANRTVPLQIIQGRQTKLPEGTMYEIQGRQTKLPEGTMYEIQLSDKKN